MPQFLFTFHSDFSAVTLTEDAFKIGYLILITIDSYFLYILFENEVSVAKWGPADAAQLGPLPKDAYPTLPFKLSLLYAKFRASLLNWRTEFMAWFLMALLNSFLSCLFFTGVLKDSVGVLGPDGHILGLKSFSLY